MVVLRWSKMVPPNAEVYLGKQPAQEREVIQGGRVVTTMVSPWYSSGRNMVGDNFFISVALVEELLQQGLTYVGTMRKNKPDSPPPMLSRNRQELSSQ